MRIATLLGAGVALLLFGNTAFAQQMKLGLNPYTVQKSALLELNSTNQGLLLARITDTNLINAQSPPDGMVIYFTVTKQLMVRSNGAWQAFVATTGAQNIAGSKTFSSALSVVATNPLTLTGVQTGLSTDSLLTITGGTVRKLPASTFVTSGSFWATGGNTVGSVRNLGTLDAFALPFITNSAERMRITSTGNVGIGTSTFDGTNPEKLLIDAGTTASFNLIEGHGRINNYLQFNIQNDSAGTTSSSDLVATANNGNESVNFVDLGINSSGFTGTGVIGGVNNAYLYSTGNDFAIGNGSSGKSLIFFTGGTGSNERMRIDSGGKVAIGITLPTARLHLPAGTATIGTAPLKFTSGVNLSTAEDGAVEYNGTNYFVTSGTTRYTLAKTLTTTATLDFPALLIGANATLTVTVTGAADGDVVALGTPNSVAGISGATIVAWVSAANTVSVKFTSNNIIVDPPSATFRVSVLKY